MQRDRTKSNLWLTVVLALAFVGIFGWRHLHARLSADELRTIRHNLTPATRIVDVRTPAEFAAGHIDGAINIPLSRLPRSLDLLGKKTTPLVVYCRSGNRSGQAARFLRQQGFEHVFDVKTMANWRALRKL